MGGGHSRELELAQQQVARLTKDLKKVSTELVFKESALAAAIKPDLRTFKPLLREQQAVAESCSVNAMACRTSTGDMRPDDKKLRG